MKRCGVFNKPEIIQFAQKAAFMHEEWDGSEQLLIGLTLFPEGHVII